MKTRCLNFVHVHNALDVYELTIQEKRGYTVHRRIIVSGLTNKN